MKVIQVVKTNRGATWAFNQARCLNEKGVDIITILPQITGGYADKYISAGMRVIEGDWSLPFNKPWKFFSRIKAIRDLINEEKPDIIHLHFVTNVLMTRIALRKDKSKRLFQVPGPLHLENSFFRFLDKFLSTPVDFWAGACKKTCEIYRSLGIDNNHIFLAYYGTFKDEYKSYEYTNKLHKEYNIDEESPIVSMVSYFYKPKKYLGQKRGLKGHEDFIDALEIVLKTHPEITPMIIGNAWDGSEKYEKQVIKYAQDKLGDRIIFTGYRNDIQEIYPELSIAVHPSHSENLGGAAESLAYAVPTITSDVGGFPDIVIPGKTGYLVPPKKPNELAKSICECIENYEISKKYASNGQLLVRNLLDVKNSSTVILDLYKRILNES